jgi:hypothetical protein
MFLSSPLPTASKADLPQITPETKATTDLQYLSESHGSCKVVEKPNQTQI